MAKPQHYELVLPREIKHPLIISAPHVGTAFPDDLAESFLPEVVAFPYDADWLVHEVYRPLASELGVPLIYAKYSRYVVDLNRDPKGTRLYNDGRQETAVVPLKSFAGNDLYKPGVSPTEKEVNARIETYHAPYFAQISALIGRIKKGHEHLLFYDAHSIKRHVPTIREEPFPDMIVGTNSGASTNRRLAEIACASLSEGGYDVRLNEIFKGGYLTRYFGNPESGIHAIQLERCWDLYLQDDPRHLDEIKAARMRACLNEMFTKLLATVATL